MPTSIKIQFNTKEEVASYALFQSLLITLLGKNIINESELATLFDNATNLVSGLHPYVISGDGQQTFEDAKEFVLFTKEQFLTSWQAVQNNQNQE